MYFFISVFFYFFLGSQQLEIIESWNQSREKKKIGPTKYPRRYLEAHEMPMEKKIKLTKYPREKNWIHEIPMGKNFGSMKYSQKEILDRRNTQVKKFQTHEIPQVKFWTQWKYRKKLFIISKAIDFYKKRCKRFAIIWWNCWLYQSSSVSVSPNLTKKEQKSTS